MQKQCEDFTVGWICGIDIELRVACKLLDDVYESHQRPLIDRRRDTNVYTFGCMCGHDVVIACLPEGQIGTVLATIVAERMKSSFPSLQFGLLVGIAGAAPTDKIDIRLGDVAISFPNSVYPGVIQYDYGKTIQEKTLVELTRSLSSPPVVLLQGLSHLKDGCTGSQLNLKQKILDMVKKHPELAECNLPAHQPDILCHSSHIHKEPCICKIADLNPFPEAVNPSYRSQAVRAEPVVHYGLIASASNVLRDAVLRDKLAKKHDILCFEMEAAGLMNSFPFIVIRGMSDYADTHEDKDEIWQPYAAAVAAVCAKELLKVIPTYEIAMVVASSCTPQSGVVTESTETTEYNGRGSVIRRTLSQTSSHSSVRQADDNRSLHRTNLAQSRTHEEQGYNYRAPMSRQQRVEPQQPTNVGVHDSISESQTALNISKVQEAFDDDFEKLESYNDQFHSNEESKADFKRIVQNIKLRLMAVLLANGRWKHEQSLLMASSRLPRPQNPSVHSRKSFLPRKQSDILQPVHEDSGISGVDLASSLSRSHIGGGHTAAAVASKIAALRMSSHV